MYSTVPWAKMFSLNILYIQKLKKTLEIPLDMW
jgi:hypothetical protein